MTPLLVALAVLAGIPPGVSQEDWDETLAALAVADAAASAADLADLAGPAPLPGNILGWQRRWRPGHDVSDLVGADLAAGRWGARVRLRGTGGGPLTPSGALRVVSNDLLVVAGWWSWRAGFGLLAGAAGRRPGLTADGGVLPARSGPRAWTGSVDGRARRGAAVSRRFGRWHLGGAYAVAEPDGQAPLAVAAVGRADGRFTVSAVAEDGAMVGAGGAGRWEAAAWRGAWEVVWRRAGRTAVPTALGAALEWRPGPQASLGAVCVASYGPAVASLAAPHELVGSGGGDGWAVRGSWLAAPRVRFQALVSDRRRQGRGPGAERRRLLELQVRCRPSDGLETRVRYRGSVTDGPSWDPDWPWEAPRPGPAVQRRTVALAVTRTVGAVTVRADLRTLALAGTGHPGRRSLLGVEARRRSAAGTALRVGWHEAWGDPVDLVAAVSSLPGRLAPRHWGAWRGEIWAGVAHGGRRGAAAAACHLRRPRLAGPDVLEIRTELALRW